jgi:peptidyl-prolyl cis-trans isomerase C
MSAMMLSLFVALQLVFPSHAGPGEARPQAVVAESAGVVVSSEEVSDAVREARLSGDVQRMSETLSPDGLERIARNILEMKLLAREARTRGVDKEPGVARTLTEISDNVLARQLVTGEIERLDTSDAALKRYYDTHTDSFRALPRRRAHHIVVKTREEATAALAEIHGGASFESVAAERNADATKAVSGNLGWVSRGVMVKAFDDALFALDHAGATSDVVSTSFGFHIIRIDDVDPGSLPPFELIKDKVKTTMADEAVDQLKARVVERSPATFDRRALTALLGTPKR